MRTSPLGSTLIQRGCFRSVANALTLSPGAATGFCPSLQPLADGIFNVGSAPCGFASGTTGAPPQAGAGAAPCSFRHRSATPPTHATTRAIMLYIVILFPFAPFLLRAPYPTPQD